MVLVGSTTEENEAAQARAEKLDFYRDTLASVYKISQAWEWEEMSAFSTYMDDERLFTKLIDAFGWRFESWEDVLVILEWEFYIFWEEFSEDEIVKICQSYIEEEDIEWCIDIIKSFEWPDDSEGWNIGLFLSNFPGNVIWSMVWRIRNTPFCRKIRDKIARINWI